MSKFTNPTLIGSFVLGALLLSMIGIIAFGGGALFSNQHLFIAHFDRSVNGLSIGAPVKLKGVAIGKVTEIRVEYDKTNNKVLTPVVMEVDLSRVSEVGENSRHHGIPALNTLIQRGLRAQLQMSSFVTGQFYVDVNFYPGTPVILLGHKEDLPEIPSIRSSQEEIEQTIETVFREVGNMPIKEMVQALAQTAQQLQALSSAPELLSALRTLDSTLKDTQKLVQHVDQRLDPALDQAQHTLSTTQNVAAQMQDHLPTLMQKLEGSLDSAQRTLTTFEHLSGRNAPLQNALDEFTQAAHSLRALADYLERHPNAVLYGKEAPSGGR